MPSEARRRADAERFRALHRRPEPLVLLNCWDAASARVAETNGFPAIATTSAGVAWSHGFPDGGRLPWRLHVETVARIVEAVAVPVSVDVENGYAADPEDTAGHVHEIVSAGAVGINLEDGFTDGVFTPAEVLADKIRAIREKGGEHVFINARTDVFFGGVPERIPGLAEAVRRAAVYFEAGADGFFAPGLNDLADIRSLAADIPLPLNIYADPGVPAVPALAAAGVKRVSVGCGPLQRLLAELRAIGERLIGEGSYEGFLSDRLDFGQANRLFGG